MLQITNQLQVTRWSQHVSGIDQQSLVAETSHGNRSPLVQQKIAAGVILFGGMPSDLGHKRGASALVGGRDVGAHDFVSFHFASFGHVPEIVCPKGGLNFPANKNTSMMRKSSGRFAIVAQTGIGQEVAIPGEDMQIGFNLTLTIDKTRDQLTLFEEI